MYLDAKGPWTRLQGLENALPCRVTPPKGFFHATVSGSIESPRIETKGGVTGEIIAGFDIFREDPKDAPTPVNKDHYFVMRDPEGRCWLFGPYGPGDPLHWIAEVPDEFANCDVLTTASR